MPKIEKLLQKMRDNPRNIRFEDIESLLTGLGFELRSKGSHYTFRKDKTIIMVVKPHGGKKFTAMADVRKILAYLKEEGHV
jgi:predicted RNA binding protein YcfA (HicA-like mRNA interferase family)